MKNSYLKILIYKIASVIFVMSYIILHPLWKFITLKNYAPAGSTRLLHT